MNRQRRGGVNGASSLSQGIIKRGVCVSGEGRGSANRNNRNENALWLSSVTSHSYLITCLYPLHFYSRTLLSLLLLPPLLLRASERYLLLGQDRLVCGRGANALVFLPVGALALLSAVTDGHAHAYREVADRGANFAPGWFPVENLLENGSLEGRRDKGVVVGKTIELQEKQRLPVGVALVGVGVVREEERDGREVLATN